MPSILIVDDVKTDQLLMKKALEPLGYSFIFADSGEKALELAEKEKPALIVLDVVMPGMDGFATCRRLKRNEATKSIPVIICTTKSGESDKFWGERQGADAYITKPFKPEDLLEAARKLL